METTGTQYVVMVTRNGQGGDRVPVAVGGFPELAGVVELRTILGVSKQHVQTLRKLPEFPAPVAELSTGAVWLADDVRRYAASRVSDDRRFTKRAQI